MNKQHQNELSSIVFENINMLNKDTVTRLEGRLLTLVDAIFTDPEQRKAVKDNVRGMIEEARIEVVRNAAQVCADIYHKLEKEIEGDGVEDSPPWFAKKYGKDRGRPIDYKDFDQVTIIR